MHHAHVDPQHLSRPATRTSIRGMGGTFHWQQQNYYNYLNYPCWFFLYPNKQETSTTGWHFCSEKRGGVLPEGFGAEVAVVRP
jgi:hypothetical protein